MTVFLKVRCAALLLPVLELLSNQPALSFDENDLKSLLDTKVCIGCDLRRVDLRSAKLTGVDLKWSRLQQADLRDAELDGATLIGANLEKAKLEGASLRGARLEGARLWGVDLAAIRLTGADLRWADITHFDIDVDLEHVELVGVKLDGAWFKNDVRCGGSPERGGWGCAAR